MRQMFPVPKGLQVSKRRPLRNNICSVMGCYLLLLLLLLLRLAGQGLAESHPEMLQAPVGSFILVQCHYRLQDVRARKVWCRFFQERCQPLVTSTVDRGALGNGNDRIFLTDLGGGLMQVEMVTLQEEDTGEYGCVVEGAAGTQILHRVSLLVLPPVPSPEEEKEVEDNKESYPAGSLPEDPSLGATGSPHEFRRHENSIPLIWGAALLLVLLVVAVVLFAVMARRKGNRLGVCGRSGVSGMESSSAAHCISDAGLAAGLPTDMPYVRLDSPPSFDTTYTGFSLDPPSRNPPALPTQPPLPPKVLMSSKPVTYATVVFPGGEKGEGASCEPAQDLPNSQTPPS